MPSITAVLRAPQVLPLLTASLVGRLPLGAAPLALLLYARESLSLAIAGLLVAAYTAGMAVSAPLLARTVDRWRQPPVLWGSAALSGLGFLIVAFAGRHPAVLLVGAAVAGFGTPPLEACLRALWPDLVRPDAVPAAYTLDVAAQELIFVVGPLVTLAAVALGGSNAGLVAAGLLQLAGVAVFALNPAVRRWRGVPAVRHWAGPLRVPPFVVMVIGVVCVGTAFGSIPVAVTGYAEAAGDRSLTGWLVAAQAGGALAGGLLYLMVRAGGPGRLPLLTAGLAAGFLPLLIMPAPLAMAALLAVSGLLLPPVLTSVFLGADRLAPAGTAVEAFAWIATAFTVGSAVGAAVTGPLVEHGLRAAFWLAPAVVAAAAAAMAASVGTARRQRGLPR